MARRFLKGKTLFSITLLALSFNATGQTDDAGLAQELTNPIADLITVPIQVNYDQGIGPADDGTKIATNVQPVIPIKVNEDWNLITRTIVPIVHQEDIYPGAGSQFGLGDINLTLFFSPLKPSAGGMIWGAGPVFLLPTATDSLLGAKKWTAGPAGVVIMMRGPWTMGMLANHVWSYAGDNKRQDISNTFIQPFISYTWPSAWTVSAQSESNYNWKDKKWSVPINVSLSRLVRIGKLPVSLSGGMGYWAKSPANGPQDFRVRLQANIVLPKSLFAN